MHGIGILPPPARGRDPLEEWEGANGMHMPPICQLIDII